MQVTYSYRGNAYRMVYTSKFSGAVYVLHAFQKKAKQGIATPRTDVELIQRRNRLALEHHQGKGE